MAILADVKNDLRVNGDAHDTEISDLIDAAKMDLMLAGVIDDDTDILIKTAIIFFCKANFGIQNEGAESWQQKYDQLKSKLMLIDLYMVEV